MYSSGDAGAGEARKLEEQRQSRIRAGQEQVNNAFATFTPSFYDARAKAYQDNAAPTMWKEYRRTSDQADYAMQRRGLQNSTAKTELRQNLSEELGKQQRNVADAAQNYANDVRGQVENSRANLMSQVIAGGDPNIAATNAMASASAIQRPTAMGPVGDFFSSWTNNFLANRYARTQDSSVPKMFGV